MRPMILIVSLFICLSVTLVKGQQPLTSEFIVNTNSKEDQRYSDVIVLKNGNFVVVWQSEPLSRTDDDIFCQILDNMGNKIGNEIQVNTYTSSFQSYPSIDVFDNGDFIIVWQSQILTVGWRIYGQILSETGNKIGNETLMGALGPYSQINPKVKVLDNDKFVVVWTRWIALTGGLKYEVHCHILGRNISTDEFISLTIFRAHDYYDYSQSRPVIARLNNESFVVAWHGSISGNLGADIIAQIFNSSGDKIGTAIQVNNYTDLRQVYPDIAALNNGNFIIVWHSERQIAGYDIFGQLFHENGTKDGVEFLINNYTSSNQITPTLASVGDKFAVVWDSYGQDGSQNGLYGQLFLENGDKFGDEFLVNVVTRSVQRYQAITGLDNQTFVVTWNSYGQVMGEDIIGRIFSNNIAITTGVDATSSSSSSSSSSQSTISSGSITSVSFSTTQITESSSISSATRSNDSITIIISLVMVAFGITLPK